MGKPTLDACVLQALRTHGPSTPTDLGRALGVNVVPVRSALARLRRQGLVQPTGAPAPLGAGGNGALLPLWEAAPDAPTPIWR